MSQRNAIPPPATAGASQAGQSVSAKDPWRPPNLAGTAHVDYRHGADGDVAPRIDPLGATGRPPINTADPHADPVGKTMVPPLAPAEVMKHHAD